MTSPEQNSSIGSNAQERITKFEKDHNVDPESTFEREAERGLFLELGVSADTADLVSACGALRAIVEHYVSPKDLTNDSTILPTVNGLIQGIIQDGLRKGTNIKMELVTASKLLGGALKQERDRPEHLEDDDYLTASTTSYTNLDEDIKSALDYF